MATLVSGRVCFGKFPPLRMPVATRIIIFVVWDCRLNFYLPAASHLKVYFRSDCRFLRSVWPKKEGVCILDII